MKRNILLTSLFSVLFVASSFAKNHTQSEDVKGGEWGITFDANDITLNLVSNDDTGWALRTTENVTTKATLNIAYGVTYNELLPNLFGDPNCFKGTGEFVITGTGTYDAVTGNADHDMSTSFIDTRAGTGVGDSARTGNGLMSVTFAVATAKFGNLTVRSNNTVNVNSGNVSMNSLTVNSGANFTSTTDTLSINGAININSANVNIDNLTAKNAEGTVIGMGELKVTGNSIVNITTQLYQPRSKITTSGTSQVTVTALEKSGETSGSVMQVNDSSTLNLNLSQNLTWDTKVSVANGATFNLTNTKAKNIIDANLEDGATASLSTSSEGGFFYVSRWVDTNWGEGGTVKTSISFNKSINIFSSSATDLHTLSVGSNTELKVGGDIILTRGTLVLNGSNQIKNISNEAQAQGDFLVLKFAGEKSGTLSLGADNAVKSIGFTTSEGGITPGTGLIELNGYEFTFNEFIESGDAKISFVDFAKELVKFTGDKDSLSTNDDGSLKYIFAGADADQKLWLGENGYLSLTSTAVPEPAEWAAIFGAIALGFVAYRKRK